jgi:hypothetical protein
MLYLRFPSLIYAVFVIGFTTKQKTQQHQFKIKLEYENQGYSYKICQITPDSISLIDGYEKKVVYSKKLSEETAEHYYEFVSSLNLDTLKNSYLVGGSHLTYFELTVQIDSLRQIIKVIDVVRIPHNFYKMLYATNWLIEKKEYKIFGNQKGTLSKSEIKEIERI